ncbi:MAG: hypothetical protein WD151_15180 [Phycisphaeraceae bacterium]
MGIILPDGETLDVTCRTCGERVIIRNAGAREDVCFCPYCGACTPYTEPATRATDIDREIRCVEAAITLWRSGGSSVIRDDVKPRSEPAVAELRYGANALNQLCIGELYGHKISGLEQA